MRQGGRKEGEEILVRREGGRSRSSEPLQSALHFKPLRAGSTTLKLAGWLLGGSSSAGMWATSLKQLKKASKVTYLWSPSSLNSAYLGDGCLLERSLIVLITYMNATLITFPKCLYFMRPDLANYDFATTDKYSDGLSITL